MKIVYRAADILEAHIVSGMLAARGIQAYVGGHYLQGAIGDLPPLGFANVSVANDDFDAAMTVIGEYKQEENAAQESRGDDSGSIGIFDF